MTPSRLAVAAALCAALAPATAFAQDPATSAGPMKIETIDSGFVAAPEARFTEITSRLRLDAGVGYRAIAGADLLHEQLRGVSGSIALRFGGH